MRGFFRVPAAESLPAAVPGRRPGRLDRTVQHQGLRPRHGGRSHRGRLRDFGLGVGIRRKAGAEQFRQEPVLLSVHVRRRPASRTVLHQQPERRRAEVHVLGRGGERTGLGACRDRCQAVRSAAGSGRRHAGWLADHVGGDRLGRAGRDIRRRQAASRRDSQGRIGNDRPVLRHHLYLGNRRHHPDLQISAALVGRRCQGSRQKVRGPVRRQGCRGSVV